jgi:hypothetical protein
MNHPKKVLKGKIAKAKRDCPNQVHSNGWFSGLSDRRLELVRGSQRHSNLS